MSDDSGSALDPDKIPKRRGLHIRDIKEEAPEPEQTVGNELRTAREAAGKELDEVAAALRIKPEHLIALEAAEYDKLPAKTYVVGFVRQYAQQLGLNANELVDRLKVELEGPPPEEEAPARGKPGRPEMPAKGTGPAGSGIGARSVPGAQEESRLPITSIVVVVILLLIVIFGGWYLTRPSGDTDATADKEPETGAKSAPAAPEAPARDSEKRMPDPPVIPASADKGAGAARNGGSLAALLPGVDPVESTDGAGGEAPGLNMPDAAAMAVPIENSVADPANAAAADGALESEAAPPGDLLEVAMPQPNLALRTTRGPVSGLPDGPGIGVENPGPASDEPPLEEIEAEGAGGAVPTDEEVANADEASSSEAGTRPRPQPVAEEEPAGDGTVTANSRVTLRVRSSTWVRVEDADGRVVMERDMRSGDSFRAPDKTGLYLVTKDAGAIELLLDGESIGRAGQPKQVLTGLLLSPDQLRQHVAQNAGPDFR